MKMIEVLREKRIKSLKEIQENTNKWLKEMNKTSQDPRMQIKSIKHTLTEFWMGKKIGIQTGTTETSFSNKI